MKLNKDPITESTSNLARGRHVRQHTTEASALRSRKGSSNAKQNADSKATNPTNNHGHKDKMSIASKENEIKSR